MSGHFAQRKPVQITGREKIRFVIHREFTSNNKDVVLGTVVVVVASLNISVNVAVATTMMPSDEPTAFTTCVNFLDTRLFFCTLGEKLRSEKSGF